MRTTSVASCGFVDSLAHPGGNHVLKGYEAWEAKRILDSRWSGRDGMPTLTQTDYDGLMDLQAQPNAVLSRPKTVNGKSSRMPLKRNGSRPGERRGGRKKGTPNKVSMPQIIIELTNRKCQEGLSDALVVAALRAPL
jgi:hypothetical protein